MHKIKHMLVCALVALAGIIAPAVAQAQAVPARFEVSIAYGADTNAWAVPALQDGRLLSLQTVGVTNSATLAVKHLIPYGAGAYVTNTVEAALAADTLYVYPEAFQPVVTNGVIFGSSNAPVKPRHLVPGDILAFDLSATNTAATVIITTGVR